MNINEPPKSALGGKLDFLSVLPYRELPKELENVPKTMISLVTIIWRVLRI